MIHSGHYKYERLKWKTQCLRNAIIRGMSVGCVVELSTVKHEEVESPFEQVRHMMMMMIIIKTTHVKINTVK